MTKRFDSLPFNEPNFSCSHLLYSTTFFHHGETIDKLRSLIKNSIKSSLVQDSLETDTWDLIIELFNDRLNNNGVIHPQPYYTSEKHILDYIYSEDTQLRELQIILIWLERKSKEILDKTEANFECIFSKTNPWENTKHVLDNSFMNQISSENFKELHPDSEFCTLEKLHNLDIDEERKFLSYLLLVLRAGDFAKIQKLCISRGEVWRALLFEGWRVFHAAKISDDIEDIDEGFNEGPKSQADEMHCEGNPNRNLFKHTCLVNSNNKSLSGPNRAIYAALAGNLDVLTDNMPEVHDNSSISKWENFLWAHIRCFIETKTQVYLETKLNSTPHSKTYSVTGSCLDSNFSSKWHLTWPAEYFSLNKLKTLELLTRVSSKANWEPYEYLERLLTSYNDPKFFDQTSGESLLALNATISSQLFESSNLPKNSHMFNDASEKSLKGLSFALGQSWHTLTRQAVILRNYKDLSNITPAFLKVIGLFSLGDLKRHPIIEIFSAPLHINTDPEATRNMSISRTHHNASLKRQSMTMSLRNQSKTLLNNSLRLSGKLVRSGSQKKTPAKLDSEGLNDPRRSPFKELLRFTMYLYASLTRFKEEISPDILENCVETYLAVLIADRYPTEMILKCSSLFVTKEKMVAWLAFHFYGLDSIESREMAISAASQHGLSLMNISFVVVRLLRRNNRILSFAGVEILQSETNNMSVDRLFEDQTALANFTPEDEENLLKCCHWLSFDQNNYVHLLRLVNSSLRSILLSESENIDLIERILDNIPPSIYEKVQIKLKHQIEAYGEDEASNEALHLIELTKLALNEHQSYLLYLEFIKEFNLWFKEYHKGFSMRVEGILTRNQKSQLRKSLAQVELQKDQHDSLNKWSENLQVLANQVEKKMLDMWSSTHYGWLKDPDTHKATEKFFIDAFHDEIDIVMKGQQEKYNNLTIIDYKRDSCVDYLGEDFNLRQVQIDKLRSKLIVKAFEKTIEVLQCSNMHQECLQLADIMVDPRLNLYTNFTSTELGNFLQELANSSIILQSEIHDALGNY